jgi:GTP-binding protein
MAANRGYLSQRFLDCVRVDAYGGRGGRGCASFVHTATGRGAATGANGGRGGDVLLRANRNLESFNRFRSFNIHGGDGTNGAGQGRHGRTGRSVTVDIPTGTIVREILSVDPESRERETRFVADLSEHGETLLLARGGAGGRGNRHFANTQRRFPTFSTTGDLGEVRSYELELKTIADVGLVGFPNAGKSSLLGAVSNATPKVAAYPFTTLRPTVGIVDMEHSLLTMADIPGLIEGAHANRGLGHSFLRHIERTRVLLFVLDTAGTEGRDPVSDYLTLLDELRRYSPDMLQKRAVIFANKMDRRPKAARANLERLRGVTQAPLVAGSVLKLDQLEELVAECHRALEQTRSDAATAARLDTRPAPQRRQAVIM